MGSSPFSARRLLVRFNLAAAWLAGVLFLLGLGLFVHGRLTPEPHAGLWGLFLAIWVAPFAGAFWLAGQAWRRSWRHPALLQLLPVLILAGWCAVGWWLQISSGVAAP